MEWLSPWYPIGDELDHSVALERELHRELGREHPLFNVPVRALACRQDRDDVLYALEDGTGRVAVVHLTWTKSPPERAGWPGAAIYPNLEIWMLTGMASDHDLF